MRIQFVKIKSKKMKTLIILYSAIALMIAASCNKTEMQPYEEQVVANNLSSRASTTGEEHQMNMPAYFDDKLYTVNMKEMSEKASDATIDHNRSINEIYAYNDLDEPQDFIPVLDAIQGDGFNPLWIQVLIVFNEGFTPHQFTSEDDLEAAAEGDNPEITLVTTDEVYRCSVIKRRQ